MPARITSIWPIASTIPSSCPMASTCSISSFYLTSQRELYPGKWYKTILYLPFLMSLGIGLTVLVAAALVEGNLAREV